MYVATKYSIKTVEKLLPHLLASAGITLGNCKVICVAEYHRARKIYFSIFGVYLITMNLVNNWCTHIPYSRGAPIQDFTDMPITDKM